MPSIYIFIFLQSNLKWYSMALLWPATVQTRLGDICCASFETVAQHQATLQLEILSYFCKTTNNWENELAEFSTKLWVVTPKSIKIFKWYFASKCRNAWAAEEAITAAPLHLLWLVSEAEYLINWFRFSLRGSAARGRAGGRRRGRAGRRWPAARPPSCSAGRTAVSGPGQGPPAGAAASTAFPPRLSVLLSPSRSRLEDQMLGPEARSSAAPDSAGVSVEQTVTSLYRPARGNSDHRTNLENNLVYGKLF